VIFATGYRTHGFVAPMEVVGDRGQTLAAAWGDCPRAYLGLTVPGFPNLFLIYGPNTNGGTGSVIHTIEAGIQNLIAALDHLGRMRAETIEVRPESYESYNAELRAALSRTVWHAGCTNWYVDERGNDPNQWPCLWSRYRTQTDHVEPADYTLA
jgi:cation diffusion facilitator CzcD-associated flavoprotein CzcO